MDYVRPPLEVPIPATMEETGTGLEMADRDDPRKMQRPMMWQLHAKWGGEEIRRLLACGNCLTRFPYLLGRENRSAWKQWSRTSLGERVWGGPRRYMPLVETNRCPSCKRPVSSALAEADFVGVLPGAKEASDDAIRRELERSG